MENLKQLVEDFVKYTRTWSISETEWYWNVECVRKPKMVKDKCITWEEFERAVREEILYCFIYNIESIKHQMENDLCCGYESEIFNKESIEMEKKIQKLFKDFKLRR